MLVVSVTPIPFAARSAAARLLWLGFGSRWVHGYLCLAMLCIVRY